MRPVTHDAQPLEFLALDVYKLVGILTAAFPHGMGRKRLLLFAKLLLDLEFDRQTVAVPPGHIYGTVSLNVAGFYDNILEDLVQGMTKMQMAVGIRGAVMQTEGSGGAGCVQHGLIYPVFFPPAEHFRLALRKVGLHGEGRAGQVQRFFVVAHECVLVQESLRPGNNRG